MNRHHQNIANLTNRVSIPANTKSTETQQAVRELIRSNQQGSIDHPLIQEITEAATNAALQTIDKWAPRSGSATDPQHMANKASAYITGAQELHELLTENPDHIEQANTIAMKTVPDHRETANMIRWDFENYLTAFCDQSLTQIDSHAETTNLNAMKVLGTTQKQSIQTAKRIMHHQHYGEGPSQDQLAHITELARQTQALKWIAQSID